MNGTWNSISFCPPPPLWEGAKRSNIIKFQKQSQFQRFLNQTLCVISQMKDIKHSRRDFHSVPIGHAPEVGLEGCWGGGSKIKFSEHSHVAYQIKGDDQ